ncbi:hypothetical protein UA74_16305 [Actinoalloteichus fjordicus]|uniref:Uncharacterized protein n=2 Tax=Actinoalloteichus fjordicus TaxID=1612552 RepID=A0AAC9PSS5_9PSEU|nr:hypothetical protein UA74_16305 [Actinoalloteichus fjordicus]
MSEPHAGFPTGFDHRFLGLLAGTDKAFFGLDVLRGLVDGINDHRREHDTDKPFRTLGPALLGAFLWLDDNELIQSIANYSAACVVVSKQQAATGKRSDKQRRTFDKLRAVCDNGNGFPTRACPELTDLAPGHNGRPVVVGPHDAPFEIDVPVFRSIGPRRVGNHLVPILHTKMVLLGHLWWHDEGADGHVEDVIGFTPQKLWLASANGTTSSRRNLEFGLWLTDPDLLEATRAFLTCVIRHSEDIDPSSDLFDPEFDSVEFDDEAMAEAAAELAGDDLADHDYRYP